MSFWDLKYLLAFGNLCLCVAIIVVCSCRIDRMSGQRTFLKFRVNYSVLLMAALASGLQPLFFGQWPSAPDLLVNAAVFWFLASGRVAWRNGAPEYTSKPMPLDQGS